MFIQSLHCHNSTCVEEKTATSNDVVDTEIAVMVLESHGDKAVDKLRISYMIMNDDVYDNNRGVGSRGAGGKPPP